jgi:hypothetical protein
MGCSRSQALGKSRDPVIAKVEMLRFARMAAMRKLRCGGVQHDEWPQRAVFNVGSSRDARTNAASPHGSSEPKSGPITDFLRALAEGSSLRCRENPRCDAMGKAAIEIRRGEIATGDGPVAGQGFHWVNVGLVEYVLNT